MNKSKQPNLLIHESSPYLLQHAYNPVQWRPWGNEALAYARETDKPIILSIGYSSCHWCHVMERESFENEQIAEVMNREFVCIKVDREERPDVDQIYMEAVQMMGMGGGWPLNVFLTPDEKPFYGGTYFPPQNWLSLLQQVAQSYKENKQSIVEAADKMVDSLAISDIVRYGLDATEKDFTTETLRQIYSKFASGFDTQKGGMKGAPKFPMPSYWKFALHYFASTGDESAKEQAVLTLQEMAFGGIYDQIGGGFARYSVDAEWFAPHFEKMLYDNGQLLSLYSEAFVVSGDPLFRETVYQTIDFMKREMMSHEGGFYSALDAESEGEEGKFYVWDAAEFDNVLYKAFEDEEKSAMMATYYHIEPDGNWEARKNILYKTLTPEAYALQQGLTPEEFRQIKKEADQALLEYRDRRVRPGLDDKILTGWNGLALKGLVDAYKVFKEQEFKTLALKNAAFIREKMLDGPTLYRSYKDGKATIKGYLEDYALTIQAFIELYQLVFDEEWLNLAAALTDYTLGNFYDAEEHLFHYDDQSDSRLIVRKKELFDNVIPSSNAVMAQNLYILGNLLDNSNYTETAEKMVRQVGKLLVSEPRFMSTWAAVYAMLSRPLAEIALVGDDLEDFRVAFEKRFYPNKIFAGSTRKSSLPLLQDRPAINGQTTIYVCYNRACQLPVNSVDEALTQLQ